MEGATLKHNAYNEIYRADANKHGHLLKKEKKKRTNMNLIKGTKKKI